MFSKMQLEKGTFSKNHAASWLGLQICTKNIDDIYMVYVYYRIYSNNNLYIYIYTYLKNQHQSSD